MALLRNSVPSFLDTIILKSRPTKMSYILKQTCSFKLQVCLGIYDLLVDGSC